MGSLLCVHFKCEPLCLGQHMRGWRRQDLPFHLASVEAVLKLSEHYWNPPRVARASLESGDYSAARKVFGKIGEGVREVLAELFWGTLGSKWSLGAIGWRSFHPSPRAPRRILTGKGCNWRLGRSGAAESKFNFPSGAL